MVYAVTEGRARFTGVPPLCVEVTSGNWANDLILKRAKYAAAGIGDHWVVDRRERVLREYEPRGDLLVESARHTGHGTADARFAGRTVGIDLGIVLHGE